MHQCGMCYSFQYAIRFHEQCCTYSIRCVHIVEKRVFMDTSYGPCTDLRADGEIFEDRKEGSSSNGTVTEPPSPK